jgi:hypothetical protein
VEQGAEEQIIRGTTWDDNKEREQREMSDIAAEKEGRGFVFCFL